MAEELDLKTRVALVEQAMTDMGRRLARMEGQAWAILGGLAATLALLLYNNVVSRPSPAQVEVVTPAAIQAPVNPSPSPAPSAANLRPPQ